VRPTRHGTTGISLPAAILRIAAIGFVVFLAAGSASVAQGRFTVEAKVGKPYQRLIEEVADRHGLDHKLLSALVDVESARNARAVSPKGARGLGQLMPGTAERFGVRDIHDPEDNLDGAAQYLRWLIGRYDGNLRLALAAYNAGEGAVDRRGTIPDYPETVAFVQKVLARAGSRERDVERKSADDDRVRVERDPRGRILLTNTP
jgi:soluble lytic murein transglycosylase-like protein